MRRPGPDDESIGRRRSLRVSRLLALVSVAAVVSVPFVAKLVDRTADSIAANSSPIWLGLGWTIVALLASAVVVHLLRRLLKLPSGGGFALAYDSLPFSLLFAWIVLGAALATHHRLLASIAGALCLYHLVLMAPRLRSERRPRWSKHAPILRLGVANVFVDNPTPERSAIGLIGSGVDVLIINESNPKFIEAFDAAGGAEVFPHRLHDADDTSTYAVTVVSRLPFSSDSAFTTVGRLRIARLGLTVDATPVELWGTHLYASLEANGYERWVEEMDALRQRLEGAPPRLIVAGDFNTTHFRPEFMELLRTGMRDAHDTLGRGWSRSIKIRATGVLSSLGPIARLDHALLSNGLWPMHVKNLPARGSDHLPFVLDIAVRPEPCLDGGVGSGCADVSFADT